MQRHYFQYDPNSRIITGTGSGPAIPIAANVVELKWKPPFAIENCLYDPNSRTARPILRAFFKTDDPVIDLEILEEGEFERLPELEAFAEPLQAISDAELNQKLLDHSNWLKNGNKQAYTRLILNGYDLRNKNLNGANLSYCKMRNCDLSDASLEGTLFVNSDLVQTKFERAKCNTLTQFQDCELRFSELNDLNLSGGVFCSNRCFGASFKNINFSHATMIANDFRNSNFEDAKLRDVKRMDQSNFGGANLSNCSLINADCSNASFNSANLQRAAFAFAKCENVDFRHSDCTQTAFESANLTSANLAFALNVHLDNNLIIQTRFTPAYAGIYKKDLRHNVISWLFYNEQKDLWNTLRREYTGVKFFLYMFLTLLFFSPVIFRLFLFKSLEYAEKAHLVSSSIYTDAWKNLYGWEVLLGIPGSAIHVIITCFLLAYNGVRAVLTFRISLLNDEVLVSGTAPPLNQYKHLIIGHYFIRAIIWFVLLRIMWEVCVLLSATVKYPNTF